MGLIIARKYSSIPEKRGIKDQNGIQSLSENVMLRGVDNVNDFQVFLDNIGELEKRERLKDILNNIKERFPQLKEEIRWNQPMFSDHGTFIIGFSVAKEHIAVAPEAVVISLFEREIEEAGYSHTQGLFRIKWTDSVDFNLIYKMVEYNIEDKKDMTKFWR